MDTSIRSARRSAWRTAVAAAAVLLAAGCQTEPDGAASPQQLEPITPSAAGCSYAPNAPVLADVDAIVRPNDAVFGPADAPVTFVEFFEPNCTYCITFHPTAQRVKAQYGDRVRFVFKPIVSAVNSMYQTQALFAAQEEGRFMDMLDAQFASGRPESMTADEIAALADEIGMDGAALVQRIDAGAYRTQMMANRADFMQTRWQTTPAIAIDGRRVANRSPECLAHLLEQALES